MDMPVNKARKTEKPWGYELLFGHTDRYVGKILFVRKGQRLSLQYHRIKDETIFVQRGKVKFDFGKADGAMITGVLSDGDSIRVEPFSRHRIEALEDSTLLEVSTPELDDVERLSDDYGRAGR